MHGRVFEMENRCIFLRCLELELKMLLQVIIEGVGVFSISRIADLYGVAISVNRIHGEVEGINGFTIVM